MAGAAEAFTEAVEADFMVAAGFTAVEASPAAAALGSSADIRLVDIAVAADIAAEDSMGVAASTAAGASTAAEATAGAVEVGAMEVTGSEEAGAGDMASAGRIGDMAGDTRMATTAPIRDITRLTLIRIRPTVTRRTT